MGDQVERVVERRDGGDNAQRLTREPPLAILRPRVGVEGDDLAGVPSASEAIAELEQIFQLLPDFGVPSDRFVLDLALARGLDYYTGPVFEAAVTEPKIGSVGGAGRYDRFRW